MGTLCPVGNYLFLSGRGPQAGWVGAWRPSPLRWEQSAYAQLMSAFPTLARETSPAGDWVLLEP